MRTTNEVSAIPYSTLAENCKRGKKAMKDQQKGEALEAAQKQDQAKANKSINEQLFAYVPKEVKA